MTHVAWADGTWVFDNSSDGLEQMLQDLAAEARLNAGLVIRCDMCGYAQASGRRGLHRLPTRCSRRPRSTTVAIAFAFEGASHSTAWERLRPRMGVRPEKVLGSIPCEKKDLASKGAGGPEVAHVTLSRIPGAQLVWRHMLLDKEAAGGGTLHATTNGETGSRHAAIGDRGRCNLFSQDSSMVRSDQRGCSNPEMGCGLRSVTLEMGRACCTYVRMRPYPFAVTCPLLARCIVHRNSSSNALAIKRPR